MGNDSLIKGVAKTGQPSEKKKRKRKKLTTALYHTEKLTQKRV